MIYGGQGGMKAAVYEDVERIVVKEVPKPSCPPAVSAAAIYGIISRGLKAG